VVCSGGRRGKDFTYALLDECAPDDTGPFERDEAIIKLADRYLQCHSPATVRDFAWWSGLTAKDARAGFEGLGDKYLQCSIDGNTYLLTAEDTEPIEKQGAVRLLPNFDESFVAYADRTAAIRPGVYENRNHANVAFLGNVITVDGLVVGTWRRTVGRKVLTLQTDLFVSITESQTNALFASAGRLALFHGLPLKCA
jgi:hypothetical protein